MEIPKEKIIDLLRERGADDKVAQAQQELPEQVDPEKHKDLLDKLGVDPQDLLGGASPLVKDAAANEERQGDRRGEGHAACDRIRGDPVQCAA
jgi:hypothetical protein